MTIRSFPQGDASSRFAQDDSGCFAQDDSRDFAQDDSGCFAQDDSRDFAPRNDPSHSEFLLRRIWFLTDRSFPQGDASSLFAQDDSRDFAQDDSRCFAQDDSGCFAQDDSGCFAQDDSRDFAPRADSSHSELLLRRIWFLTIRSFASLRMTAGALLLAMKRW